VDLRDPSRLLRYSVELLVVFLGVWLGLLAENYREVRQTRAAEQVSLGRIIRDLEVDHEDMLGNLGRATKGRLAAVWLLERADATDVSRDSLELFLTDLQESSILSANTSEYTALKSAGRINIIRNPDLRQRLTQLYESYPYIEQLHDGDNAWLKDAMVHIAPYVRVGPPRGTGADPGFGSIKLAGAAGDVLGQSEFLLAVSQLALYRFVLEGRYEQMLDEVKELQRLAELERGSGESLE